MRLLFAECRQECSWGSRGLRLLLLARLTVPPPLLHTFAAAFLSFAASAFSFTYFLGAIVAEALLGSSSAR